MGCCNAKGGRPKKLRRPMRMKLEKVEGTVDELFGVIEELYNTRNNYLKDGDLDGQNETIHTFYRISNLKHKNFPILISELIQTLFGGKIHF